MTSEESGTVNSMIGAKLVRESWMVNDKCIEMMLRIFCVQRCLKIQRIQIVDVKQKEGAICKASIRSSGPNRRWLHVTRTEPCGIIK